MNQDQQPDEPRQESQPTSGSIDQPTVQSSVVSKQSDAQRTEQHAKDGAEASKPLFVQIVGGEELEPFEKQTLAIARETLKVSRNTYWIAVLAFLAAAAAAVFVYSQVKIMSYQTQIMAGQAASDAVGGSLSAVQVQRQLDLNRQTLRVDQRAWIAISFDHAIMEPTLPFTVALKLQNLGKTPARHCLLRATVETAKDISHLRFEFKKRDTVNAADMESILPTANVNLEISEPEKKLPNQPLYFRPLTQPRLNDLVTGKIDGFVHGKLTYDDAFDVHHWTEFCFTYAPDTFLHAEKQPRFVSCQQHNEIDDNLE